MLTDATSPTPDHAAAPVRVALIEDNRLVRQGLTALLESLDDITVVAGRSSGDSWPADMPSPHVVLIDMGLRQGNSVRIAVRAMADHPGARVVVMDLLPAAEDLVDFVHAGVSGFIRKDATLEELANTIRAVARGEKALPRSMATTLFSQIARDAIARGRGEAHADVRMTPREREVVNLIAEGLSNKEIASRLHIATHTVKSHVRNVMDKLALHTRLQIAAYVHSESRE